MKPKKLGLLFALAAFLIGLAAYTFHFVFDKTPPGGDFWIYSGFVLPLLLGITGQGLAGCNFKVGGCGPALIAGFVVGFALLLGLYFSLGFLIGKILERWQK